MHEVYAPKVGDCYRIGVGIFAGMLEVVNVVAVADGRMYVTIARHGDGNTSLPFQDFAAVIVAESAVLVGWRGVDRLTEPKLASCPG